MNRKRQLYMLGSLFIVSFVVTTATLVYAAHQWSCWHWNHGNIKITNNATGYWNTIIGDEFNDWDVGTCVSFGSGTEITGDSGFYGNTGWLGIARLLTVDSGACLILSAEALLNQTYMDGGTYPETADRHVACQEIGHTLGLDHDRGQPTCMDDQVLTNPFFRQHDTDMIASITLNCTAGCITNTDCDDLDPCTTDVCTGGSCSNTPISCPTGQTCNGGICEGQGACCTGTSCSIGSPSNCSTLGGSYLGDGSVCGSGSAGNPTVYQSSPNATIPDGGGSANPATDTINVPDSVVMGDVNVDLTITHTWVGDVTVTVSHLGTSVTIVDRPGVPGSTYGCSNDNYSGILLDDEGTGGTMESQCALNLSSPPNYTPNNPLSAFDGLDSAGIWTITVYDSVSADGGTLNTWSLHIDGVGSNPCTGCTTNAQCDDGVFCNGAETCVAGSCQAGTTVNCNDGVGCTTDTCNEGTASCDNVPNNGNCDDGLFCNGTETCDAVLDCQAGTVVNCSDGIACTNDSCNEATNSCDNVTSNANCDDGLFCNGAEVCDVALDCQPGTAPNCNDGVGCTNDSCNEATNSCDNVASNASCDNGLFCDGVETCDAVLDCQAGTAINCNDGVGCTNDSCNEATNSCDNVASNANCDNGLFCDGVETCDAVNDCQAGTAVNCNDGVGCTTDSCNEATNSCDNITNNASCDNGLFCDGVETCDAVLDCQAGIAVNCNDGVGCTNDSCNEATNSCDNVASNANCDNGLFCDGVETCDAVNDCQAGTAVNCNDGIGCTDDSCNEATTSCDNIANNANCPDDGIFCNGTESCSATLDCVSSGDPCVGQACDEATASCVTCLIDADCSDGLFCNGVETCSAGVCLAGTAVNCNDGVGCTVDSCNEATTSCDNIASNASCDNGIFCDGVETCDAVLDCQAGAAVNCNDGVACTDDSCNEATSSCDNVANNANCNDGLFCNGVETCDAVNDCLVGADPCPGQLCDEATAVCVACLTNPDCDDGIFCNGAETCSAGVCQAGTAINCNDGVGCTTDSCNEATSSCDNMVSNASCDNGIFCDGAETCDAVLDCQAGVAVNCNDGVGCTTDSCNEATNACDNIVSNASCDNGLFCDGVETCDAVLDCQAGVAVNCNDGIGCTNDSCNEVTNACDNVANNANCDDGLFCNGAETCSAALDCQAGSDPCPGQTCDEVGNQCVTGPAARLESGTVTVGGTSVTVSLTNTYVSPVVVCTVQYNANTIPVVTRVSGVTSNSFNVRLQNPSGSGVAAETVSYIVVEKGVWTINGVNVEAQTYLSTITDENNSWVSQTQAYGQSYTSPVVLGQVMTENDANWSVFWDRGSGRNAPPNASNIRTGKTVCEDSNVPRADETVGFIVFEAGHGTIGGVEFEAALGADKVRGVGQNPPYSYSFNTAFASTPVVTVTTMAAMDGNNGGWAQTHGGTAASASTLFLSIDEDQIKDGERNHTTEQVGYVVFLTPVVYP